MPGCVYIVTNRKNGTLYTGVTSDIAERAFAHREGRGGTFAAKYGCTRLVWFEAFEDIRDAIAHEKRVKKWKRAWKINVIEAMNPNWHDLSDKLHGL